MWSDLEYDAAMKTLREDVQGVQDRLRIRDEDFWMLTVDLAREWRDRWKRAADAPRGD